jgi:feruloyl-CoA synthase
MIRHPMPLFAPAAVNLTRVANGVLRLSSSQPLQSYPRCLNIYLLHWASQAPERPFLRERAPDGSWSTLTYGQALKEVLRLARWLLMQDLSHERPIAILSGNSLEHALLMLGALHIGVAVLPISPAYSLQSRDFGKLRSILQQASPGVVYVDQYAAYARALEAVAPLHDGRLVIGGNSREIPGGALRFEQLQGSAPTSDVEAAFAAVTPDTVAKILFTSGSTGEPKGVINTQRMLCSNQQAKTQVWPFLERGSPVLVDWLPWNHTFGGNHNFNLILRHGGTLYIDQGRPVSGRFAETARNLREIAPTLYFNVPRGYEMLIVALQEDEGLRQNFFSRLQVMFYAAASLPESLWHALIEISRKTLGEPIPLTSAWGSTETSPLATDCHFQADRPGVIGLPVPGCELKLLPVDSRYEARVRGPLVTPGYWRRPDLTAQQFDEEGFYRIGDAVRFVAPDNPEQGLVFDGRVAEDFKLSTGTWVHVNSFRLRAIAALAPIAQDVVVAGHDRSEVGLLIFPDVGACRALCGAADEIPIEHLLKLPEVRSCVATGLLMLHREGSSSSTHATRALVLAEPPSADAGEITDKAYINQRAVLGRRKAMLDLLYQEGHPEVIRLSL